MNISKIRDRLFRVELWLAAALILRLCYLMEQSAFSPLYDQLSLDEMEAAQIAKNLLAGTADKIPLYKAPFYSWYLAFWMKVSAQSWFFWVRLGQHLAGVFLIGMAVDCTRMMLRDRKKQIRLMCVAMVGAFLAVYAPLIRLENRVVLDFWTVFFQSGLIWALFRWMVQGVPAKRWLFIAGFFAALAWLNRPTLTLVMPFLAVWVFCKALPSQRKVSVAVLLLPVLFSMAGMGLYNQRVSGEMLFLPWQGGYDLWMSNRPGANGRYLVQPSYVDSQTANPAFELSQSGYLTAINSGEVSLPDRQGFYKGLNRYWVNKTVHSVLAQPGEWLGLYLKKSLYLVNQEEIYSFESYEVQKEISAVLKYLPPLGFGFIFPLALTGWMWLKKLGKREKALFGLLWMYAVTYAAATALYYTSGRMRMPLLFPTVLLAAESLAIFIESRKDSHSEAKRFCVFFGLLFLGIALSWGDWWGVRSDAFRDREYLRLSSAFYAKGQAVKALEYAERAEQINPAYPTIPLLKGQACYALGRYGEAADSFHESMRRLPEATEAAYNLGVIYWYYLDEGAKALDALRIVISRDPGHAQAAALASIAEGLYGSMEESGRYLKIARQAASPGNSLLLEVAEIAALKRQQQTEEVNQRLKNLWERVSTENNRKMLMDDLKRAQVL